MEHLTKESFKTKIFDFESSSDWKFEGDLPCIIDFYADWCGPCKMIAPLLEELAKDYDGKINIFKVNTEDQQEIAAHFGITSIPSLLFVPKDDKPQMKTGAMPKQAFIDSIKSILMVD